MKSFRIIQTTSGQDMGVYEGINGLAAIAAMLMDAGCYDAPDPGLVAVELQEPELTVVTVERNEP